MPRDNFGTWQIWVSKKVYKEIPKRESSVKLRSWLETNSLKFLYEENNIHGSTVRNRRWMDPLAIVACFSRGLGPSWWLGVSTVLQTGVSTTKVKPSILNRFGNVWTKMIHRNKWIRLHLSTTLIEFLGSQIGWSLLETHIGHFRSFGAHESQFKRQFNLIG